MTRNNGILEGWNNGFRRMKYFFDTARKSEIKIKINSVIKPRFSEMDTVRFYRLWKKTAKPGKIQNSNTRLPARGTLQNVSYYKNLLVIESGTFFLKLHRWASRKAKQIRKPNVQMFNTAEPKEQSLILLTR
jgi:hypothetical protein